MATKVTDLMVGDWIRNNYTNDNYKLWPSFFSQATDFGKRKDATLEDINCEPVPLTDEILNVNGFNRKGGVSYWHEGGRDASIIYWSKEKTELIIGCPSDDYFVKMPVRYVHELQHAFRLAGIDKEIKLEE